VGGPHRNGLLMTSGEVRKPFPGAKKPGVSASSAFRISRGFFSASGSGSIFCALSSGKMESKVGSQEGGE